MPPQTVEPQSTKGPFRVHVLQARPLTHPVIRTSHHWREQAPYVAIHAAARCNQSPLGIPASTAALPSHLLTTTTQKTSQSQRVIFTATTTVRGPNNRYRLRSADPLHIMCSGRATAPSVLRKPPAVPSPDAPPPPSRWAWPTTPAVIHVCMGGGRGRDRRHHHSVHTGTPRHPTTYPAALWPIIILCEAPADQKTHVRSLAHTQTALSTSETHFLSRSDPRPGAALPRCGFIAPHKIPPPFDQQCGPRHSPLPLTIKTAGA